MQRPMMVPMITENTTAGIFSISTMELIPMAMEQQPKIMLIFSLKSAVSLLPTEAPMTPPIAPDNVLTMTPRGMRISSFVKME